MTALPLARGRTLPLDRPLVMGILNVTPDSFSDGGQLLSPAAVAARAMDMIQDGADILDIGGQSTRPGAAHVAADEELRRVVPAIGAIRAVLPDAVISVDTSKASVAQAALAAGADMLNDVTGLGDPDMASVAKQAGCAICLMRWDDAPADVVAHTERRLREIRDHARAQGISNQAIILDPGLGFGAVPGADPAANLALLKATPQFKQLGCPILIGASRKRFIGALTGEEDPAARRGGSVAIATAAIMAGADIVRVHDVRDTVQAARVAAHLR